METDQEFTRGQDYDGVELWFSLMKYVCPTTKVSSSNYKDELGEAHVKNFDFNTKNFNLWFEGKRKHIIRYE